MASVPSSRGQKSISSEHVPRGSSRQIDDHDKSTTSRICPSPSDKIVRSRCGEVIAIVNQDPY
ncbi:hypothetical protein E8E14_009616 [Neopestalotiopsis sp. 37M]|nr:hypothetical protein E8E14_009616 [Neopestalotiopsis sp. 37M]